MHDCIICGAGPAGTHTAEVLANHGLKVLVLEEHEKVGIPVHCTGIIGQQLISDLNIDSSLIRCLIESVKINFPCGDVMSLPTSIKPAVIDRSGFDKMMEKRAQHAGAEIRCSAKVEDIIRHTDCVDVIYSKNQQKEKISAKLCIISTGSMSALPYMHGISKPENLYFTAQVDAEIKDLDGIELFVGEKIAPGSFAYAVSTSEQNAKIGLIVKSDVKKHFDELLNHSSLKNRIINTKDNPRFRVMPFGISKKTVSGRLLAVGDAAGQLKTTTGGGLYYGYKCSQILSKIIIDAKIKDDFDLARLKKYDTIWKSELRTELQAGLALRNYLEREDDAWWDKISDVLKDQLVQELIWSYKDFDRHYKFIFQFFKVPAVRKFLLDLLKSGLSGKKSILNYFYAKNRNSDIIDDMHLVS